MNLLIGYGKSAYGNQATNYNMAVLNHSTIISTAPGSTAVTLESTGFTDGNIYLENGGLIQGGAGGSAIALLGGNNNLVVNDSSLDPNDKAIIRTAGTVFDTVITGTSGHDAIQNLNGGTIVGSVHLGSGNNSFLNGSGSMYLPGNTIYLGSGNLFSNSGYLSPGGLNTVMSASNANGVTALTGNFSQSATGHLVMDANFSTGSVRDDYMDFVSVSGAASLGGFVTINPSTGAAKPGKFSFPMMTSAGVMTAGGISVFPTFANGKPSTTVVFQPSLSVYGTSDSDPNTFNLSGLNTSSPTVNTLYLNYSVDYAPSWLAPNQKSYANMVNQIQTRGVPTYQPIAAELLGISDPTLYRQAIDSLTGEGTTAAQQLAFDARKAFGQNIADESSVLIDCSTGIYAKIDQCGQEQRSWISYNYGSRDRDGGYSNPYGHSYNSASVKNTGGAVAIGQERLLSTNQVFGWALGVDLSKYNVADRWTSGSVDSLNFALYGMQKFQNSLYIKGMVLSGHTENSSNRIAMGRSITGTNTSNSLGARVELGLKLQVLKPEAGLHEFVNVTPFVAYQHDRQRMTAYSESDNTWGNYYPQHRSFSSVTSLGVKVEGKYVSEAGTNFSPFIKYMYSHEANAARSLTGSPLSARDFSYSVAGLPAAQYISSIDVAVDVDTAKNQALRMGLSAARGDGTSVNSLQIKYMQRF
ncbi:hypothetical protein B9Z34_03225 [Limnohabitans sp. Hippo3]|nr:hypothetical protein B9Z34_03225 [Limnohabitans sp. Hippo3]